MVRFTLLFNASVKHTKGKSRYNQPKMIYTETEDAEEETLLLSHEVQSGPPFFLNSCWSSDAARSKLVLDLDNGLFLKELTTLISLVLI